jgi:hypothetical protein
MKKQQNTACDENNKHQSTHASRNSKNDSTTTTERREADLLMASVILPVVRVPQMS